MNENAQQPLPPLPIKPKRQNKRRAAALPKPQPADEFAGLTVRDCCLDCSEKKCIITDTNICGHPLKASHPGAEPKVLRRIAAAKKVLAHQKIEAA